MFVQTDPRSVMCIVYCIEYTCVRALFQDLSD
jgi:hypothetical protein